MRWKCLDKRTDDCEQCLDKTIERSKEDINKRIDKVIDLIQAKMIHQE